LGQQNQNKTNQQQKHTILAKQQKGGLTADQTNKSASKVGRNNLTSQNVHSVMSQYIKRINGHRNICRVIDYEVVEKSGGALQSQQRAD
jgi:hypothetical protein